jgi:thiol-disulfide isomerase/thioredoxin
MFSKVLNILIVTILIGYAGYFIYKMPKYNKGEEAPDFESTLIDGSTFHFSDLRGDIVLLDFWGSWCGPCRKENPYLVTLYQKYGQKNQDLKTGFHIVSVAVESNATGWKNAIQRDRLVWPFHIYEEGRFKSPIVKMYGIKEIPTKYLIDSDGDVVMINPNFKEMDTYLADNLK